MGYVKLTKNKQFNAITLLFGLIFMALIRESWVDVDNSRIIAIIMRTSLSMIILMIIANKSGEEKENTHVYIIGVGYVISNIFSIISLFYVKQEPVFILNSIMENILEVMFLLSAIVFFNNKHNKHDRKAYCRIIALFIFIVIWLIIDHEIILSKSLHSIELLVLSNLLVVFYTLRRYEEDKEKRVWELKYINLILYLKIVYFIFVLVYYYTKLDYDFVRTVIELIGIVQIHIVYKIIIRINIINPYIEVEKINEEINIKSKEYEHTNKILEELNEYKSEINKSINYRDDFFNSILESTPNPWVIFNEKLEMTYFNKVFENVINYNGDIILNLKRTMFDYEKFINAIYYVCNNKSSKVEEITMKNKKIYNCMYKYCEKNKGCICMLMDITIEKEMLNDLVALKEEYEDLIINIKSPVFICDEDNKAIKKSKFYEDIFGDEILYINEEYKKGKEKEKYFIHPDEVNICKYVKSINRKAKTNEETYNRGFFRYRVINGYGDIRWLESNTTIDYKGQEKYIIIAYSDITEYVKVETYLEKTQNMYKELLSNIPEGIYLEDIETEEYMFVNKKFKNIFDIDEAIENSSLGKCRKDLMRVHPDYEYLVYEAIDKVKDNKVFGFKFMKYITKNNEVINAQVASIPFRLGSKALKLTIIEDMIDVQYLEDLKHKLMESKKRDQMKMEFFINMSHELKTPLNLIFTSTQLLENLYSKGKVYSENNYLKNHVELTKQNSYRLIKIINDLIDFTKMESGFYKVRTEKHEVVSVIEDIVMSVVTYANIKGVNLIFDTEIEDLVMSVDVNATERIILNIISNAIKFTDKGGYVYVNIYDKDDKIDVVIEDTGIGIPKDKIDVIFERFNDVNKGFIGNIYGSGIGLSMVKSMCQLIDANVNVESEYGVGTKFTISFKKKNNESQENDIEEHEERDNGIERLIVDMADIYK